MKSGIIWESQGSTLHRIASLFIGKSIDNVRYDP